MEGFPIHNTRKAFTLVEIIILLGVIGIMISGILALFFNIITVNKSSAYYSTAYKVMDSKMEELRNISFASVVDSSTDIPELPSGEVIVNVTNEVDGAPQDDIKKVDLVISWTFRKETQIREVTYITKGGIKK